MRRMLFAGVAAAALLPAPGQAQAPAGDAILDRLNALEAKVAELEARNRALEAQLGAAAARTGKAEGPAVKTAEFASPAPTVSDGGDFMFRPRGFIQLDYAAYRERAGGYDYNDGTDARRARFGFDGTAFKSFNWRLDAEYVKNTVNLLDAYVQYSPNADFALTVGHHKAPFGLESNTSDLFIGFLERSMANNAFGAIGAERRLGVSASYAAGPLIATAGVFGASEAVGRNAATPDEVTSVTARVTWEPILEEGRVVHLGVSAYRASGLAGKAITLAERPGTRVDDGRIISVTLGPIETGPIAAQTRGVKDVVFLGAEAAGVLGPFSLQGEYGSLRVDRYGAVPDLGFDGFYVFGSLFVTGESRPFRGGVAERVRPLSNFGEGDGIGAVELLLRYDRLDLTDRDLSPITRRAETWTGGVTWYLNPFLKLMGNYIRFTGLNSPLVVAPVAVNGTTAKGDAAQARLQFDF